MTPWQIAGDSESSQQKALFAWANMVARIGFNGADNPLAYTLANRASIPENVKLLWAPVEELAYMFAVPNGGKRDGITAARMKAEGVKAGVPDIFLPVYRHQCFGLFLELKKVSARPKRQGAGGVSDKQTEWMAYLNRAGYATDVGYGWEHAADIIKTYMMDED